MLPRRDLVRSKDPMRNRETPSPVLNARPTIEVELSDHQGDAVVDGEAVGGLVRTVVEGEGVAKGSISVALVDDATIHVVNRRHLAHDWPTDVISFRLSGPGE